MVYVDLVSDTFNRRLCKFQRLRLFFTTICRIYIIVANFFNRASFFFQLRLIFTIAIGFSFKIYFNVVSS